MSDFDWENEDFEPPTFTKPVLGDRWEGEDEDDVKENWDDEDADKSENAEEENPETNAVVPPQTKKKKVLNQIIAEKEEKKRKELQAKQAEELEKDDEEITPEEIYAEKLKQMKLQEDADLELAKDAFGVGDIHSQGTIDSMVPSTREDFDNFRKALVNKIVEYEKSIHYMPFLEDFLREMCLTMEPEDIKKLSSALNAVANEKVKAQKTSKHKKKTNKGRAALNVGKGDDYHLNEYGDEYDDFI